MTDTIYHIGHLAADRGSDFARDKKSPREREVNRKARLAMLAAVRGEAVLYQRRCPQGFEYHCRLIAENQPWGSPR